MDIVERLNGAIGAAWSYASESPAHEKYAVGISNLLGDAANEITSLRKQLEESRKDKDWRPLLSAPLDGTYVELLIWHHNHFKAPENQKENWEQIVKAQWIDFNGGGWTWSGMSGSPQGWRTLRPTIEAGKAS